jgi:hypothetical protein
MTKLPFQIAKHPFQIEKLPFQIAKLRLLSRSLNILFEICTLWTLFLKTKYTLSIEFVLARVRGNNHWRTSQVRLEILNDRTLYSYHYFRLHHLKGFWKSADAGIPKSVVFLLRNRIFIWCYIILNI